MVGVIGVIGDVVVGIGIVIYKGIEVGVFVGVVGVCVKKCIELG